MRHNDAIFFRRFPHRRYRVRRIFPDERTEFEEKLGQDLTPPPGFANFIAVENVRTGVRLRVHFQARDDLDADALDEATCAQCFWDCIPAWLEDARRKILEVAP